jgi:hypothetical protein
MLTKEQAIEKRESLLAQRNQMVSNINAMEGAIQLLNEMIDEPDSEEKPKKPTKGAFGKQA